MLLRGLLVGVVLIDFLELSINDFIAPGGLLVYETFTRDQRALGWGPRRDAFLLEAGELPTLFPRLEVMTHEERTSPGTRPEAVARLAARKLA